MDLAHFRMLINELLNKDPDIVPDKATIFILDTKSAVCMDNNGEGNKYTRHIAIIVQSVRNSEKCKIHKIDWCERDLQLADITTKNVIKNDLNPRIKYIMVRLDNREITPVQ